MSNYTSLLLTFLVGDQLLRVAFKFHNDELSENARVYYMKPESRAEIKEKLPPYIADLGDIIEIDPIYDVATCGVK